MERLRDRRGFSLLEVLFAIAILSVALIPMMSTSQMGIRRSGFNTHRITATMLANQLMERYKTMPYKWLDDSFSAGVDMADVLGADPVLASPFLPQAYRLLVKNYDIRGTFEDVSGDASMGLLSFELQWKASPKAPVSTLKIGKIIVNYSKFGIDRPGPAGPLVQTGDIDPLAASLPAPAAYKPPPLPTNPVTLVTTIGSGFC